jgi:hypothetical protein
MDDPGAKESFQVCYDSNLGKEIGNYLIKHDITVDGESGPSVAGELAGKSFNALFPS